MKHDDNVITPFQNDDGQFLTLGALRAWQKEETKERAAREQYLYSLIDFEKLKILKDRTDQIIKEGIKDDIATGMSGSLMRFEMTLQTIELLETYDNPDIEEAYEPYIRALHKYALASVNGPEWFISYLFDLEEPEVL